MRYSKKYILLLSLLMEGVLILIFFLWVHFRSGFQIGHLTAAHVFNGIIFSLPLFLVNFLLFGPLCDRLEALKSCADFKDRVVLPLAAELDFVSAAVVAALAGLGEELFFRGVLQTELGIVVASLLFSLLHFGPAVFKYFFIALIYACIGYYFGVLVEHAGSLWPAVVSHSFYDYIALLYLRYIAREPFAIAEH